MQPNKQDVYNRERKEERYTERNPKGAAIMPRYPDIPRTMQKSTQYTCVHGPWKLKGSRCRIEGRKREAEMRKKLELEGRCPVGYHWIRQQGGWRCAGGSHYVPDGEM